MKRHVSGLALWGTVAALIVALLTAAVWSAGSRLPDVAERRTLESWEEVSHVTF